MTLGLWPQNGPSQITVVVLLLSYDQLISIISSWWLNHPFEKYADRQIGSFPQGSG